MSKRVENVLRLLVVTLAAISIAAPAFAVEVEVDPNSPGIQDPTLSEFAGHAVRIPHTDQHDGNVPLNVVDGTLKFSDAKGFPSLKGHAITEVSSPNDDMKKALADMSKAAKLSDVVSMKAAATWLMNILKGETSGFIYDGFAMLNYNHNAPGEYKTKTLTDTGKTETVFGAMRKIWEVDVSMFFYDGQIDSDTFLVRVPVTAHKDDTFRVNYTVYSVVREEFSPTTVMLDHGTSVSFPFKGFDSVWIPFGGAEVMEFTMKLPPLRMVRGIYTWGWRVHPPRIHFLQPIFEVPLTNNSYGNMARNLVPTGPQLEPQGLSFAYRNRELSLAGIGEAAPEKKMWRVARATLDGASGPRVYRMLNEDGMSPRGTWDDWADLAKNQRQLPPEAWDILGGKGNFGPYRFATVYVNNEMYGEGPEGSRIEGWNQGDRFTVKVINLDNHTHYFRNVDFGPRLNDDIAKCCPAGSHSFEIMNFKPSYGAPKVAEMQWRAGWGFRPHFDVIQQADVFPRASDQVKLAGIRTGDGRILSGYQYSAAARGGDFWFRPPPFIVGSTNDHSPGPLFDLFDNGPTPGKGLLIGRSTEGYGTANMCTDAQVALDPPPFCPDISDFHPTNAMNFPPFIGFPHGPPWTSTPKVDLKALRFPPFLRNPDQAAGGDIIAPTPLWKPFFWINPVNGTLHDVNPNGSINITGFWADQTYSHGAPIAGVSGGVAGTLDATIESPRASGQVFYQFDDLFHDNAIFSPHPTN